MIRNDKNKNKKNTNAVNCYHIYIYISGGVLFLHGREQVFKKKKYILAGMSLIFIYQGYSLADDYKHTPTPKLLIPN